MRYGVFGWGIVAPRSPSIEAFARNLEAAESWLEPFHGFGPDNFLVGRPDFRFADYKPWIDARFPPGRYPQLEEKMDEPTLFAIGAFIQALGQNPGLEELLRELGTRAHVYVGTGLGAVGTIATEALKLDRAQRRWDRFWAAPERNAALRAHQARPAAQRESEEGVPPDPRHGAVDGTDPESIQQLWDHWNRHWTERSAELEEFLRELAAVEALTVEGEVFAGKMSLMKEKQRRRTRLQRAWGAPDPPWASVSANVLWNIQNTPAAQISMLGHIKGLTFAPVAACSTFGVTLKLAFDAIDRGEARVVVVGATDPSPHPLIVGAFHAGRVIAADPAVSKPLTGMRGTHVGGGACVWIVGDLEYMTARGFTPLGMEPLAAGTSSDAEHIITPSREGPLAAIALALEAAEVAPSAIGSWDLHATATPGDFLEVENARSVVPETVLVTARKGTFGHGMSAGGGWELTAQYLGYARGALYPTPLRASELNSQIAGLGAQFAFDTACDPPQGLAAKLSMGIGGINAFVLSRPLP